MARITDQLCSTEKLGLVILAYSTILGRCDSPKQIIAAYLGVFTGSVLLFIGHDIEQQIKKIKKYINNKEEQDV